MKPVVVLRHVPHEGLGTIAEALEHSHLPFRIIDALSNPRSAFELASISGLIVMGGPMNVDEVDRFPALANEVQWLKQTVDLGIPLLGVCLGAQLLAKALGARVYANRIKEIGWYDVELLPTASDDKLLSDLPRKTTVFQWHGDTFDLPRGAVQLARSALCENQAFRCGDSAYGLQFHMEVTSQIIEDWLCQSDNCGELAELDYIDPATIRRETPLKLPPMTILGHQVFGQFAELCKAAG